MTNRKKQAASGDMPPIESALAPCVALLVHHDDDAATTFKDVFADAATDWRLVRVADSTAAARHVMQKGLPEMLVTAARLPKISGPEFVEWLRSFRCTRPVSVVVYDEPLDDTSREHFLQHDVSLFLTPDCTRRTLFDHLSDLVARVEARKFCTR